MSKFDFLSHGQISNVFLAVAKSINSLVWFKWPVTVSILEQCENL